MEYNTNVYLTMNHEDCVALNLDGTHRKNNDGTICIMEYPSLSEIPQEVSDVLINTYTHQEILDLVEQAEWVSTLQF